MECMVELLILTKLNMHHKKGGQGEIFMTFKLFGISGVLIE
jgi:hypothetical protein